MPLASLTRLISCCPVLIWSAVAPWTSPINPEPGLVSDVAPGPTSVPKPSPPDVSPGPGSQHSGKDKPEKGVPGVLTLPVPCFVQYTRPAGGLALGSPAQSSSVEA